MNSRQFSQPEVMPAKALSVAQFGQLLKALVDEGYQTYGPTLADSTIRYDAIASIDDLPRGVYDEQSPGHYRLEHTNDQSVFAYTVSQDSWKKFLFPAEEVLFKLEHNDDGVVFKAGDETLEKKAFIGVRGCELHAIAVQDRVFLDNSFHDVRYASRRRDLFIVGVNCSRSVSTCFCESLNTGPSIGGGADIVVTEITTPEHGFTAQAFTDAGAEILSQLQLQEASAEMNAAAQGATDNARQQQRSIDTDSLKTDIYQALDDEDFWRDVGDRCLNCANCTNVCPTCFCSNVEDVTDLVEARSERVRHWDSCFNLSHSHIAGGSVRKSSSSRYRQWFSHKLASWQDQFDTLGCTGCGRCITWCPVGIDITAEVARLREAQTRSAETTTATATEGESQ